MRGDARLGAASWLLLASLVIISHAGPVDRPSRVQALQSGNDQQSAELSESHIGVFPQNMTIADKNRTSCIFGENEYMVGEKFPGNTPCENCSCAQSGVVCDHIQCEVRAGCKALHKADRCCPLYQCECERNGTLYSNGEKLVDPENSCQVCYCQGGEIVCNKIACYRRDDCEPRYVAGRCCPEYDHCPPRDMEMENHIHSREPTSKPDSEKFETASEYPEGNKLTTDNVDIKSADSLNSENNQDEVGGVFRSGDYLSDIDRNPSTVNAKEEAVQEIKVNKNVNNLGHGQTINIKEVTQDKSLNNEIRIKEVLYKTNFDVGSFSTKSPTIPREASYTDVSSKESDETVEKINVSKNNKVSQDKNLNNEAFPTPPILRIGDQLLFLKLGDLVPENGTLSTPSSVFTVIGAEGLQRVEDEPEEMFEHKDDNKKYESPDAYLIIESKDVSNSSEDFINNNVTEDADKILQEVTSDLYASTTVEPQVKSSEETSEEEKDSLLFNTINDTKISENNFDSTETTSKENDQTTENPSAIIEKSTPDQSLDDEQQPIPIEHLPEHNPEYPPIPEDIMVLTMTEDSLESGSSEMEFSGGSPIDSQEMKFDEKSQSVKRPALSSAIKQNKNNNVLKDSSPVKILPDVLHLRANKTNETSIGIPLIPEDWLKLKEGDEHKESELNSPLLALSSALPDIILQSDFKDSSEEDETKEYIFVSNDTYNANLNSVNSNQPEEATTDESIISTTEVVEQEPEYRSPGEPHLIPEWERNQTTTEIPEDNSENVEIDQTEDPFSLLTTLFDTSNSAEILNEGSLIQMDKEINTTPNDVHTSNEITPLLEYSTEYTKNLPIQDSAYKFSSPSTSFTENNDKKTSLEATHDIITYSISTTEKSSNGEASNLDAAGFFDTENKANFHTDTEVVPNFDLRDSSAHTIKQKKTSSLFAVETKNDFTKKGNILADLINLVEHVAAMDTQDAEISTVSNSIDVPKIIESSKIEEKNNKDQFLTVKPLTTTAKTTTLQQNPERITVEFSEFTPSVDKIDVDIPTENDKVEVTTKKTLIDKDSDDRNTWKSTDYIVKDIEIIPKVANKISKKNSSLERIITKEDTKNDVEAAFTTQQFKKVTITPPTTPAPRMKEKVEKVLVDGRKSINTDQKIQLTKSINASPTTQMPFVPKIEDKTKVEENVLKNNYAKILNTQLKKVSTALPVQNFDISNAEEKIILDTVDQQIDAGFRSVTPLKETVPVIQATTKTPSIQLKEKSDNIADMSNSDVTSNTQIRKTLKNVPATVQPRTALSEEKIKTAITDVKNNAASKSNTQFKKLVTIAPLTIQPIVNDKSEIDRVNTNEDVIIYTTIKTTSTSPAIDNSKISTDVVTQMKPIPDSEIPALAPAPKKVTVNSESVQRPLTEQATTESSGITSTVMKVSSRIQNEENAQENASTENGRDKLTKRETNSQLSDASGQIDESLISIMRDFFEKQYRH